MSNAANPLIPKDGAWSFADAAGSPLSFALLYEDGDASIAGFTASQFDVEEFYSRGRFYAARKTKQRPLDVSFTCHAVGIIGDGTTALIGDVALRAKLWASATSTLPTAAGDAFCVSATWRGERSDYGASSDTITSMKYLHIDSMDFSEGIPGKLAIKAKLYTYSNDYLTIDGVNIT